MSAPIQLIRLRIAARIGMAALCIAVFGTVFSAVYLALPR